MPDAYYWLRNEIFKYSIPEFLRSIAEENNKRKNIFFISVFVRIFYSIQTMGFMVNNHLVSLNGSCALSPIDHSPRKNTTEKFITFSIGEKKNQLVLVNIIEN